MPRCRIIEQTATAIYLEVQTSKGLVEIIADFAWVPETGQIVFDKAHVEGSGAGILGRDGLNEVKAALAKFGGQHGAKALIFRRAKRSSGRLRGKIPTAIIIPC